MAWWWLLLAGLCEIAWAAGLKSTAGFTRLWPSVFVMVTGLLSLIFLGYATRTMHTSTAYVIWTAIGTVGLVLIGMIWQNEPRDALRLVFIGFIVVGVLGIKFFSTNE